MTHLKPWNSSGSVFLRYHITFEHFDGHCSCSYCGWKRRHFALNNLPKSSFTDVFFNGHILSWNFPRSLLVGESERIRLFLDNHLFHQLSFLLLLQGTLELHSILGFSQERDYEQCRSLPWPFQFQPRHSAKRDQYTTKRLIFGYKKVFTFI